MPCTLRSIGLKRLRDEIRRHGGPWRTAAEPLPDIALERDAVHVVVERGRERPAEGVVVDRLEDVGPALKKAVDAQMKHGKTTVIEIMCTRELGDPFRRDALSKPVRFLDKYKDYV